MTLECAKSKVMLLLISIVVQLRNFLAKQAQSVEKEVFFSILDFLSLAQKGF